MTTRKTTLAIDAELFKEAKLYAVEHEMTFTDLVERAIRREIE